MNNVELESEIETLKQNQLSINESVLSKLNSLIQSNIDTKIHRSSELKELEMERLDNHKWRDENQRHISKLFSMIRKEEKERLAKESGQNLVNQELLEWKKKEITNDVSNKFVVMKVFSGVLIIILAGLFVVK